MECYHEVMIEKSTGGLDEYQINPNYGDPWVEEEDLLDEMCVGAKLYELGIDYLPDGIEDIRGRIINEPDRVFGYVERGQTRYVGIVKL